MEAWRTPVFVARWTGPSGKSLNALFFMGRYEDVSFISITSQVFLAHILGV